VPARWHTVSAFSRQSCRYGACGADAHAPITLELRSVHRHRRGVLARRQAHALDAEACSAGLIHGDDRIRLRATWETPFTREAREAVIDTQLDALAGDDARLTKAAAITGWAEALIRIDATTDRTKQRALLEAALQAVLAAKDASTDPDLLEIAELMRKYANRL
jgi:hypothetical protein